jgi:ABC-type transport system involved in multi-copper enzyme maturation permease subunit
VATLNLSVNPILVKELRSRMRGWRAFGVLTFYLIFLAIFSYVVYRVMINTASFGFGVPLSPLIGQALFVAIANLSLFFVAFLTPALTAGAISSEQEKLTLEMLQATPLNPHAILMGKLISTTSYVIMLLIAAVPIVSLVFTFGGVAVQDMLQVALVILVTGICFGMIGLFFSAWRKRTMQAIALSYLTIIIFIGGSFVSYAVWGMMIQNIPPPYVLIINPFSALSAIFSTGGLQASPLGFMGIFAGMNPGDPTMMQQIQPLWYYTIAIYLVLTTALYLLATRFIKPIRPWRIGWREVAAVVVIAVFYLAIGAGVFYDDAKTVRRWIIEGTPTPNFGQPMPEPMIMEEAVPIPVEDPQVDNDEAAPADEDEAPAETGN